MNEFAIGASENVQEEEQSQLSEHEQKMVDIADGKIDVNGNPIVTSDDLKPENSVEETSDRPDWLPEKFESAEDMAKAYAELESKQGAGEQTTEETKTETETETNEVKMLDMDKYMEEFMKTGNLGEESRAEFQARGVPSEMIDAYLEAVEAQSKAGAAQFLESVGGQEQFQAVAEWAQGNADQNVLNAYNKAADNGDVETAIALFNSMSSQFTAANGQFSGTRVTGGAPTDSSGDVFHSMQQVTEAMKDPRYSGVGADPAYIKSVQDKLARSKNI